MNKQLKDAEHSKQRAKIMLVDDEQMVIDTIRTLLEMETDYVIFSFLSPIDALKMLKKEPVDVVISDFMMPDMDGLEFLTEARGLRPDTISILLTGYAHKDNAIRAINEVGLFQYIEKPWDNEQLELIIRNGLANKSLKESLQEKVRELDIANQELEQKVEIRTRALREKQAQLVQSAKMASLGKLSAGMSHELNNPAASVQRGAEQVRAAFSQLQAANLKIGTFSFSAAQLERLEALDEAANQRAKQPVNLDALSRIDREHEMEEWLEEQKNDDALELAPSLVTLGYAPADLVELAQNFSPPEFNAVVDWLCAAYTIHSLLTEIALSTDQISEIVKALKAYTYMDQAPRQSVDVHEGLDNTLIILSSKLKAGVDVRREYDTNLPFIEAFGSELNQVWTNIIDNAIGAMEGQGKIVLKTYQEDSWVVVEIKDTGPGIPQDIQDKIFDPFFTTKSPGEGTGLGLNISHKIIAQKHKGKITVDSRPGETCFTVKLPTNFEDPQIEA